MIPCKDCLVLAICKNKKKVYCSLMFYWCTHNGLPAGEHWELVHKYLPITTMFRIDRGSREKQQ